jgi:hypothetical protein
VSWCEASYLDPRPTSKSIARAYSSCYTHEPEGEGGDSPSPLGRFKRFVKRAPQRTQ